MAAQYEIKTAASGKFMFNLKAGNHEVILTSQMYESLDGARNGVASCQENGGNEGSFTKDTASDGQFYFTLKAGNGQVIGRSEMYKSEAGRDNGIASVMKNCGASIVDATAN
jgi:uncharacterized protein